jgi:Xaa-Pro aminopeptidase
MTPGTSTVPATATRARLERLREDIARHGWSGVLVLDLVDVRWLTGLDSSNAAVVVTSEQAFVITDFRYVGAASALGGEWEVVQVDQSLHGAIGARLSGFVGGGTVAYSPSALSHRAFLQLTEALDGDVTLRAVDRVVAHLREVKDGSEVEAIRRASALLEGAYEQVVASGLVGRTEADVAWQVERCLREAGATALSFESIVASGERGAYPHHTPGSDVIPANTLVTIDIGCVVDGYCSDCTRTFATGPLPEELQRAYDVTLEAQLASLDAIRPGAEGKAVDGVARAIIEHAGHGDHFGHGLGHGVGMQVHEAPRLSRTSDSVLDVGMVVTVEPGIYIPHVGGVRIEDLVVVTEGGCEILTGYTKELVTVEG